MSIFERIMPSSIRFVIIPAVLLIVIQAEIGGTGIRSANYETRVTTYETRVSTQAFAPEARRILAGGGTAGTEPVGTPNPGGAADRSRSAAPPGLEELGTRSRWFHHRLISGVPPGRRMI